MKPVFRGLGPYIAKESSRLGLDPTMLSATADTWHVGQVQDALGRLDGLDRNPHVPSHAKTDVFAHAVKVIVSAAASLEACRKAALDSAEAHGLDASALDFLNPPKAATKRKQPAPETPDGQL